jgi:hypothetical protein
VELLAVVGREEYTVLGSLFLVLDLANTLRFSSLSGTTTAAYLADSFAVNESGSAVVLRLLAAIVGIAVSGKLCSIDFHISVNAVYIHCTSFGCCSLVVRR